MRKRSRRFGSFIIALGLSFFILAFYVVPSHSLEPGWEDTGSMTQARASHTATLLPDGKVLVTGGFNGSSELSSAELYDPDTGTWDTTEPMTQARQFHTRITSYNVCYTKLLRFANGMV